MDGRYNINNNNKKSHIYNIYNININFYQILRKPSYKYFPRSTRGNYRWVDCRGCDSWVGGFGTRGFGEEET